MTILLIAFGTLIATAGVVLLITPQWIFGFLEQNKGKPWVHIMAVAARIVLGLLLIVNAPVSKCPLAIQVIGWIAILAAVVLAALGRVRFEKLMDWVLRIFKPFARLSGVVAIAFGYFIAWAFL